MKLSLAFLVVVAIAGSANVNARSRIQSSDELDDIINEFLALLPTEKMKEILSDYVQHDHEFQAFLDHLFSEEFQTLYNEVEKLQDVKDFYKYLAETGLNIYGFINKLHEIFGLDPLPVDPTRKFHATGGVVGFLRDIEALLPRESINALYAREYSTSPAFKDLVDRLSTSYFSQTFDKLRKNPKYCQIIGFLEDSGLDVNRFKDLLLSFFNFHLPSISCRYSFVGSRRFSKLVQSLSEETDLNEDLQEFVDLIPVAEIRRIAAKYYISDSEFQKAASYIQSEEFYKLIREVHGIPEYQQLLKALADLGLDVDALVTAIHDAIGYKNVMVSRIPNYPGQPRSLASFIAEVKGILPITQIENLYEKKLETSESFEQLVKLIESKLFQDITNELFADPIFQDFIFKAKSHGVNLGKIADFFFNVFGITTPDGFIN